MTEPSEWAREFARKYLDDIIGSQNPEDHAAAWFDAARRHGIEDAAASHERNGGNPVLRKMEADAIRALIDKG